MSCLGAFGAKRRQFFHLSRHAFDSELGRFDVIEKFDRQRSTFTRAVEEQRMRFDYDHIGRDEMPTLNVGLPK